MPKPEIVIRRTVKADWIADNLLVCVKPCLISACMSELNWIAHRTTDAADVCTVAIYRSRNPGKTMKSILIEYFRVPFGINSFIIINWTS